MHAYLRFGFVSGLSGTGGYHCNLIMLSQLLVGWIQLGIVTAGLVYRAFQIIRYQYFGYSTKELQHPDMAEKPVLQ
ncbi:hypothetical protein CF204P1_07510 [Citrobacter freundii]|nr:hypothetical protein ABR34_03185 [Citrobacter braakii]BDT22028.1 hypothetical protein CF204P1_07510 [Citrobacter freundii]